MQGLGGVFLDQVIYDEDAQILNTSLADYLVPLASQLSQRPRDHDGAATVEDQSARRQGRRRRRHGRGGGDRRQRGRRGARSLGVEVRELPLSPAQLWKLVNGNGGSEAVSV